MILFDHKSDSSVDSPEFIAKIPAMRILPLAVILALAAPALGAEPAVRRIAWLGDDRIIALIDTRGLQIPASAVQLYHDAERIESFRFEKDPDDLYRLTYRAPRSVPPGTHHSLVLGSSRFPALRPVTAELIQGDDIDPTGLDTTGERRPEIAWLERYVVPVLASLVLLSLYALYRWQKERKRLPVRHCKNCGERIEVGFRICVYCTYPALVTRKSKTDPVLVPSADGGALSLEETTLLERVPSLQVLQGPETGRRFPLRAGQVLIGRSRSADIVLPDLHVAQHHVQLLLGQVPYEFEDLSGGLGLRVNGQLLARGQLLFGDRLTVGSTTLLLLPE